MGNRGQPPQITTQLRERHTQTDVLAFFKFLDRDVARGLDIHVVLDNVSAHKAPEATGALMRRPRVSPEMAFTIGRCEPGLDRVRRVLARGQFG